MKIFEFTLEQLLQGNVHLGTSTKIWNPLNQSLIVGRRHNYLILNLNLTISHLRQSLLLCESIIFKNLYFLIHVEHVVIKKKIIRNFNLYKTLSINFSLGRWVSGFISNFKVFYLLIFYKINKILKMLKKKNLQSFLFRNVLNKFWIFFIFLSKLKNLPHGLFSFNHNQWLTSETRSMLVPAAFLTDLSITEYTLLHTLTIIPFNLSSSIGLNKLFVILNKTILFSLIRRKKFFFLLIHSLLSSFYKNKKIKFFMNLNYSFFLNYFKVNNLKKKNKNNLIYPKYYLKFLNLQKFKNFK
jgi:ribosomal protein S2